MKRLIVTDSTSDLPPEVAKQLGIKVIPVNVVLNGKYYKDGVDLDKDDFYRNYYEYKDPRTEAVKYEEYALIYMQLTQHYDEIIIIHCTRHLSDTYETAVRVHEDFKDSHNCRVQVIDSKACSMGLGLIVIAAARAAIKGVSFEENITIVNNMIPRIISYLGINTLKYLKRGGKIGGFRALLGLTLGVKPVMTFIDGKPEIITKLFGKQKNMILSMMDRIKEDIGSDPINLAIVYSKEIMVVNSIKSVFESTFTCRNIYVGRFGPSIGINTGPETVAIMFYKDRG